MILFHLPSSAGAIVDKSAQMLAFARPAKPRRLCVSLGLKHGLQTALEGKISPGVFLHTFYLN